MQQNSEVFVGIDVAKTRNEIGIADGYSDGERAGGLRFLQEVDTSNESRRRLVRRLAEK